MRTIDFFYDDGTLDRIVEIPILGFGSLGHKRHQCQESYSLIFTTGIIDGFTYLDALSILGLLLGMRYLNILPACLLWFSWVRQGE